MEKLTFKSQNEFAKAIIDHDMWSEKGNKVFFDIRNNNPFRFLRRDESKSESICSAWGSFDQEWSTEEPLRDLDLVWAWNGDHSYSRCLGIWDEDHKTIYDCLGRGGAQWACYEKYTEELPQWYLEAIKKIKTSSK